MIAQTRETPVTDETLRVEHAELMSQQEALTKECERLRESPGDIEAHYTYVTRLWAHAIRMHAHLDQLMKRGTRTH
jgi:hypothetical protein